VNHHAIERTSPKGEDSVFVGTCRKCGKTGLTDRDFFHDECPNIRGTTQEQDILEAIDPDGDHARPELARREDEA
jgi:hypothetical protein